MICTKYAASSYLVALCETYVQVQCTCMYLSSIKDVVEVEGEED